jgi:hypothetical protein
MAAQFWFLSLELSATYNENSSSFPNPTLTAGTEAYPTSKVSESRTSKARSGEINTSKVSTSKAGTSIETARALKCESKSVHTQTSLNLAN